MNLLHWSLAKGLGPTYITPTSSIVANARNIAVRTAKEIGADGLLMVDSDMVFPPDMLDKYVSSNVDIVGCPYRKRGAPYGMMVKPVEPVDHSAILHECEWLPTGLMYFRMSVFEAVGKPWFQHPSMEDVVMGEDLDFCARARSVGLKVWARTDVNPVAHLVTMGMWNDEQLPMDWQQYAETQMARNERRK